MERCSYGTDNLYEHNVFAYNTRFLQSSLISTRASKPTVPLCSVIKIIIIC